MWLFVGAAAFLFACSLRFHRRVGKEREALQVAAFSDVLIAFAIPTFVLMLVAAKATESLGNFGWTVATVSAAGTWAVRTVSSVPRIE